MLPSLSKFVSLTLTEQIEQSSDGVSQPVFDSSVAALQSKDIAYKKRLASHISSADTNTTDIATHTNDLQNSME